MSAFMKAVRKEFPMKVCFAGESDAGKSFSSLVFAEYLSKRTGKRTAAVDTDAHRLTKKYAGRFDFDVADVSAPYNPGALTQLIRNAEKEGYGQFIVDSGSDYYDGPGGLLAMAKGKAVNGNVQAGWGVVTPIQNELFDVIGQSSMHIMFTVRARNGEIMQRSDFPFKVDTVLMLNRQHSATVAKSFSENMGAGRVVGVPDAKLAERMLNGSSWLAELASGVNQVSDVRCQVSGAAPLSAFAALADIPPFAKNTKMGGENRPCKPEKLKRVIYARMNESEQAAKPSERGVLAGLLAEIGGDVLLKFLVGYEDVNALPGGYVHALLWWLAPLSAPLSATQTSPQMGERNSGGMAEVVKAEARACVVEYSRLVEIKQ